MDKLYVIYGDDALSMASQLLAQSKPEKGLSFDAKIIIKPNLVVAKPWQSGATTNPKVAEAVIIYFKEKGFNNLTIAEGSWIGTNTAKAFSACGYESLSKKYNIPLLDTKYDEFTIKHYKGYDFEISKTADEADLIINLPVIKGHCQTGLTCGLKNLKGIISDKEKRRFHSLGLHTPIAYLNKVIKNVFTIADGIYGDIDFEEGGNPIKMDTMLASNDRVLLDAYAASLLSFNPEDIIYISIAADEGVGKIKVNTENTIYMNKPTSPSSNLPVSTSKDIWWSSANTVPENIVNVKAITKTKANVFLRFFFISLPPIIIFGLLIINKTKAIPSMDSRSFPFR